MKQISLPPRPLALRSPSPGLHHCSLILRTWGDSCGSEFGGDFPPRPPPGKPGRRLLSRPRCLPGLSAQGRRRPPAPAPLAPRPTAALRPGRPRAPARAQAGSGGRPAPGVAAALASFRAPSPAPARRRPSRPPPPRPPSPRAFLLPSLRRGRGRRLLLRAARLPACPLAPRPDPARRADRCPSVGSCGRGYCPPGRRAAGPAPPLGALRSLPPRPRTRARTAAPRPAPPRPLRRRPCPSARPS